MTTVPPNDDTTAGFGVVPRRLRGSLTVYEIGVYVALSWRVNAAGECFLRQSRLAEEAGMSTASAKRALKSMRDKGIVSWRPLWGDDNSVICNVYRLHMTEQNPGSNGPTPRSDRPTPQVTEIHPLGHTDLDPRSHRPTEREPINETPSTKESAVADATAEAVQKVDLNTGRDDVNRLCVLLADLIEQNGSRRPTITKGWRDSARLMLDRDARTEDEVRGAIIWSQNHEFWRGNVLSMGKLREKYDQMRLQAIQQRQSDSRTPSRQAEQDAMFERAMGRAQALEGERQREWGAA